MGANDLAERHSHSSSSQRVGTRLLAVEESVVALPGHGRERLIPPGARIACGADHEAIVLHLDLHFVSKPCLFQEWLWDAHSLRVSDADEVCFHGLLQS